MLISSKQLLLKAMRARTKYAVGAFNTSDLEMTQAILEAANDEKSPVIIQTSEKAIEYAGLNNFVSIVRNEVVKYKIPIVLHLDHARDFKLIKLCIDNGYTSVMIDGSKFSFDTNIKLTKQVVGYAHSRRIPVEAELGALGGEEDYIKSSVWKTDPDQAQKFVKITGVDSLAVAIGNAHGIPQKDEKLDFKLLEKIKEKVKIPLVLHGASLTPAEDIKKAISLGIVKINIDTEIRLVFSKAVKEFQKAHPKDYDPRDILKAAKDAVKKLVKEKIEMFGSKGKK